MNPTGTLSLSIEAEGQEQWQVAHAVIALYAVEADDDEDENEVEIDSPAAEPLKYELLVELRMGAALQRVPDLEEVMRGSPSLQVRAFLTEEQRRLRPGTVLVQASDYDEKSERYLSNFLYFEHRSIVNVRIEVIELIEKGRRLRITGQTVINNYLKGSPDATFEAVVDAVSGEPYFKMW